MISEYLRLREALDAGRRRVVPTGPVYEIDPEWEAVFDAAWENRLHTRINDPLDWGLPILDSWPVITELLSRYADEHWASVSGFLVIVECWVDDIRASDDPNTWDSLQDMKAPAGAGKFAGNRGGPGVPIFQKALEMAREHRGHVGTKIWKEIAISLCAPSAAWNVRRGGQRHWFSERAIRTMTLLRCLAQHAAQPYSHLQDRPFATDIMTALASWGHDHARQWWRRFVRSLPVNFKA